MQLDLDVPTLTGQMLVGSMEGTELPARFAKELAAGRRGGAVLFSRNLPSIPSAARLTSAMLEAAPRDMPPFIGIDQEGGRVRRLPSPALVLPPMRVLAGAGDLNLVMKAARAVGSELSAIGCNVNFAPVLDVNTEATNPVIGDRAFGSDARTVMRFGVAYIRGLQARNVIACG